MNKREKMQAQSKKVEGLLAIEESLETLEETVGGGGELFFEGDEISIEEVLDASVEALETRATAGKILDALLASGIVTAPVGGLSYAQEDEASDLISGLISEQIVYEMRKAVRKEMLEALESAGVMKTVKKGGIVGDWVTLGVTVEAGEALSRLRETTKKEIEEGQKTLLVLEREAIAQHNSELARLYPVPAPAPAPAVAAPAPAPEVKKGRRKKEAAAAAPAPAAAAPPSDGLTPAQRAQRIMLDESLPLSERLLLAKQALSGGNVLNVFRK